MFTAYAITAALLLVLIAFILIAGLVADLRDLYRTKQLAARKRDAEDRAIARAQAARAARRAALGSAFA